MSEQTIELFDSRGRFVMPSPEQVATLDPQTQENFRAVSEAALELEAFKASRQTPKLVTACLAERNEAEAELRRVRPIVDAVANAKEWIRSQRAE